MKRTSKWKLVAVLVLVGAGAFALYRFGPGRAAADGPPRWQTARLDRGALVSQVTASGTLSPVVTVQVGSQVSGRIQDLYVDFNDRVKKGQLVARIDPRLFESELARARAARASANAALARAEAELADARRRHARTAALAEQKLVAQADADSTLTAVQAAEAQRTSALAGVAEARAAVERAETNLAYTTIVSPIDGVVISRDVDVGQTVAASLQAPTLFTIAEDLAKMEIHTNVAESDVGRIAADMEVEFTVDAFPGRPFGGVVKEVRYAPQTVQNVVTYDAVVTVGNPELVLRPGMTADVSFIIDRRGDVLRVPNAALRFRPPEALMEAADDAPPAGAGRSARSGSARTDRRAQPRGSAPADRLAPDERVVWRLGPDGALSPVTVRIGLTDGRFTEVVEGDLQAGDAVATGVPFGPGGRDEELRRRFGRIL